MSKRYLSEPNILTEQLDANGYPWVGTHNFRIRRIVEQFFRDLDTHGLSESEAHEILRIIYLLGMNKSISPEGYTLKREINWVKFKEGVNRVGDVCRISPDTYDGPKEGLNYKVGTIAGLPVNGQITVFLRTFGASVHVDPEHVEVLPRRNF